MESIAYEYVFTTVFDDAVFNNGPVQNDVDFLEWVKNCVAAIKADSVTDTTLINHKGNVYKITVNDKGPLVPLPKVDLPDHPGMRPVPEV